MENQTPQPTIKPQAEPTFKKQLNITYPILFLAIVLTAILSSLGTYLAISTSTKEADQPRLTTITTQPSPPPTNTPTQTTITGNNYPKRQFDASKKFFQNYSYPQLLLDISEQDLVGMECTPQYLKQMSGEFTLGTNPEMKLTDSATLQLISQMRRRK